MQILIYRNPPSITDLLNKRDDADIHCTVNSTSDLRIPSINFLSGPISIYRNDVSAGALRIFGYEYWFLSTPSSTIGLVKA